jgi:mutator protein MutT
MTIGAFSVIRDSQKRILLCHRRDKDLWNLPGGKVESGESPWEAAVRECQEEIAVKVTIDSLIGCYYKKDVDDLVFMFSASIENGQQLGMTDEADDIRFFSIDDLPENTAPKQRDRLLSCFLPNSIWPILATQ